MECGMKMMCHPLVFDTANYYVSSYSPKDDSVCCVEYVAFSPARVILITTQLSD